jgi:L-lactate dehydrogenase
MRRPKVFVVGGGGMVGATVAQALAIREAVHDIILVDVADELVRGQAMDINHATAYTSGVHVHVGSYEEIDEDDIVVITCGAAQKPGQTRLELLGINAKIIEDVVTKVMANGKQVYILMVTNPVDVLTRIALRVSGLPKERVFGSGTCLDTARLRVALAQYLHVSQQEVEAYILGEHGDSSFAALSHATVGGVPLAEFPGFAHRMVETIEDDIRAAAYQIIAAKKSTYYGIGYVVAKLVEALLHDRSSIFPVCSLTDGEYGLRDVVMGLPSLVSSKGVHILKHYPLDEEEKKKLQHSAEVLRQASATIQL